MKQAIKNDFIIDEEFKNLLPPLLPEEYENLEKSILKDGMTDSIKVWSDEDGTGKKYLIDGHNRFDICTKHNIDINYWRTNYYYSYDFKTRQDVIKWIIENQLSRRNLSVPEKYEILQKHKEIFEVKAKENMSAGGKGSTTLPKVDTRKEMAKMVGTSEGTYSKLDKIFSSDNDELKNKVKSGKVSVNKAFDEVKPKQEKTNPTINIENELNKINSNLKGIIDNLSDTDGCDDLLDKIEEYNKKIISIKKDIFQARDEKYSKMTDVDLKCKVVEKDIDTLSHKFLFYLTKKDIDKNGKKIRNNKLAIEIYEYVLIDNEYLEKRIETVNKKFEKKESIIICMQIYQTQREHIKRKEERGKEEENLNNEADRILKERLRRSSVDFSANIFENFFLNEKVSLVNQEIKELMNEIVKQGYRQLAKKFHPDISNDDGQQMQLLNDAKEQLEMII